jgi:hypothetical protein
VLVFRRVAAILLGLSAVVVWFALKPADHSSDIESALTLDKVNAASAESAPQQQVVNGWTSRDLLTVIAKASDGSGRDERVPTEIALGVIGLAVFGFTSPVHPQPPEGSGTPAGSPIDPESPRSFGSP